MDEEFFKRLGLSVARGVPQMATGFVDLASLPFTMTGLLEPEEAVGSTAYLTERGLLPPPQEGVVPETMEMVSSAMSPGGAGKELLSGLLGVTAYHGSPYLFKQLDQMKMGTGEGAQAYGAGAGYTAEARDVAEEYARDVSRSKLMKGNLSEAAGQTIGGKPMLDVYNDISSKADSLPVNQAEVEYEKLNFLEELMNGVPFDSALSRVDSEAVVPWAKSLQDSYKPMGYLYKGDIPDEIVPSFLDWDKPLKSQDAFSKLKSHPEIVSFAKKSGMDVGDVVGRDAYELIATGFDVNQKEAYPLATKYLNDLGVRGVRYLDQGSRGGKGNTSNFVVFQPEDFQIETINDIPLEEYIRKGLLD